MLSLPLFKNILNLSMSAIMKIHVLGLFLMRIISLSPLAKLQLSVVVQAAGE